MPIACLFAHDPDPQTALLLDATAYASCRRCGAGLVDAGQGWGTPLARIDVLRRRRSEPPALARARVAPLI